MKRVLALAALLFSMSAVAQDSTAHRHLGFLLRLDVGPGFASGAVSGINVSGVSGDFNLTLGGAVAENLIVGGFLWFERSVNPTVSGGGASYSTSNLSVQASGIGAEVIYYVMPANFYFTGSLGVSRLSTELGSYSGSTDVGPLLRLGIGKEWWVSRHWGVGIAGRFTGSTNNDSAAGDSWTTFTGSVNFSATYN